MSNFYINIDSSVEVKNGRTWGQSTVAWTIVSNGKYPYRAGVMYSNLNGPNEIIYEGMLAAISSIESRNLLKNIENEIVFYIDSTVVIRQIKGLCGTKEKLSRSLSLLKKKMSEYSNTKFDFEYRNDKEKEFRIVDKISKNARKILSPILENK